MQTARPPSSLRTFVAIQLSAENRARLAQAITALQACAPGCAVNWVRPQNIHLTLKFLGGVHAADVARISDALAAAAANFSPFEFSIEGLGCFPNVKQPSVVWAGVEGGGALLVTQLQAAVEKQLAPLGFPPEGRPFSPHITLGRLRREASAAQAARVGEAVRAQPTAHMGIQRVNTITLFKSDLRAGGPVYTPLLAASLK